MIAKLNRRSGMTIEVKTEGIVYVLRVPLELRTEDAEEILLACGVLAQGADGLVVIDGIVLVESFRSVITMCYGAFETDDGERWYQGGDRMTKDSSGFGERRWVLKQLKQCEPINEDAYADLPDWKIAAFLVRLENAVRANFEERINIRERRIVVDVESILVRHLGIFLEANPQIVAEGE